MTTPESRSVEDATVEERLAAVLHVAIDGPYCEGEPDRDWTGDPDLAPLLPHDFSEIASSVLAAAKEHGLVIGEGADFEEAVREDAPYFRRLNPILRSLNFQIAAYLTPHEYHRLNHVVQSDCQECAAELESRR